MKKLLSRGLFEKEFMNSKATTNSVSTKEWVLGHLIGPLGLIFVVNTIAALVEKFFTQQTGAMYGMADNDFVCLDGGVHDPQRADFIKRYLGCLKRAVSEGYPVLGYQYWSIMDNFEWAESYEPRFGLLYTDYATGKRIIKDSAWEYKKIIENNGATLQW